MKIQETTAKSIIVASKLPDADYVVNPYTGCQFACLYCYASFMGRFVNEPIENWGNYVYVKTNAVELCEAELKHWPEERKHSTILLSSVTDPYQGLESKYKLTRGILEVFAREQYPGTISILTKSPLVLRDVDIIATLPHPDVGMTVTTTDDRISRFLEVAAPQATRRLKTLRALHDNGIPTYAFVGPLLPHFRFEPEKLDELFAGLANAGVKAVYVEHMNLSAYIKKRLWERLKGERPEVQEVYTAAETQAHREALDKLVAELLNKHGLRLRLQQVLYHPQDAQPSAPKGE
jgi:DNA repair photolyase